MKKGIVEAFEENWVILEIDGVTQDFPLSSVQGNVEVGDVVQIHNGVITALKNETTVLRNEIEQLMKEVWEDEQ